MKRLCNIVIIIFSISFCISLFLLMQNFSKDRKDQKNGETLIDEVIAVDMPVAEQEADNDYVIDWEKLKSINSDVVGWIKIEDTNINYPIVKSENSLYYLTHSFYKEKSRNGAIFLSQENSGRLDDNQITLYGHNMGSGLMFGELKKYMNQNFYEKHKTVNIYTPEANYKGQIFSVFSYNLFALEKKTKAFNFDERIAYYKSKSIYQDNHEIIVEKALRLMTCSYMNAKTTPTEERYYILVSLK